MARDRDDCPSVPATVGIDDQVDGGQAGADQGDGIIGCQIIEGTFRPWAGNVTLAEPVQVEVRGLFGQ